VVRYSHCFYRCYYSHIYCLCCYMYYYLHPQAHKYSTYRTWLELQA
jgi:hypothetical protein